MENNLEKICNHINLVNVIGNNYGRCIRCDDIIKINNNYILYIRFDDRNIYVRKEVTYKTKK